MNFANLFRIAFRALGNNKMRGFLTMLGIIIGVASVITMLAIGQGSKRSIRAQIEEMGSNMIMIHPGADRRGGVRLEASEMETLKMDDLESIINETRYVAACSPSVSSSGQVIYGANNYPTSVYGVTKLEGEQLLLASNPASVILRTSWLYSPYGNNFVKTMLRLGREREKLSVVFDQVGTPTYAADLAAAIVAVLGAPEFKPGIYNFSDEGVCSWYDFTVTIHRLAGIDTCRVSPINTSEYPTAATRPFYSVMNKKKIKEAYQVAIPHWEESLRKCIDILQKQN